MDSLLGAGWTIPTGEVSLHWASSLSRHTLYKDTNLTFVCLLHLKPHWAHYCPLWPQSRTHPLQLLSNKSISVTYLPGYVHYLPGYVEYLPGYVPRPPLRGGGAGGRSLLDAVRSGTIRS